MPSPFPGMDPFVEGPDHFPSFHYLFIGAVNAALQASLPEPYYCAPGIRAYVERSSRQIEGDTSVLRAEVPTPRDRSRGGAAVGTRPRLVVIPLPLVERREAYIDIYTRREGKERLVAVIEVLSPANKTPGEKGRDLYLRKQAEVLASQVHLIEIDLLRGGTHVTAVPEADLLRRVPDFDYHVCIKHFDSIEEIVVAPITLPDPLPTIPIPLLPGDGETALDLQAALTRAYEEGPFQYRIEYAGPVPAPALSPEQGAWLDALLIEKGLRPRPTVTPHA